MAMDLSELAMQLEDCGKAPDALDDDQQAGRSSCATQAAGEEDADSAPGDLTCAVCLESIPLESLALVKGCDHMYCVNCILTWAMCKEWCPQCKLPFSYLITYRQLDGTVTDYPTEESVVLLKRAAWFQEHLRARDKGKAAACVPLPGSPRSEGGGPDWADFYEDYIDDELEEDEEIEKFYFSSAAGSARIVIGNRRWGGGGYMRSGRVYARPVAPAPGAASSSTPSGAPPAAERSKPPTNAGAGHSKGKGKDPAVAAAAASPPTGAAASVVGRRGSAAKLPKGVSALGSSPPLGVDLLGTSPGSYHRVHPCAPGTSPTPSAPGSGRRAKRNARRAAVDMREDY